MELWTVEEAADALQVSVRTVGTLVSLGLLRPAGAEVVPHRRGATRRNLYLSDEVQRAYEDYERGKVRKRRAPHRRRKRRAG